MDQFALIRSLNFAVPEIFLAVAALIALVYGVFKKDNDIMDMHKGAMSALVLTACLVVLSLFTHAGTGFSGMFTTNAFTDVFKLLLVFSSVATLAISLPYLRQNNIARFEYPVLIMTSVLGMFIMISAGSMLTFYLGLELQSLSLYILAAFRRESSLSSEAGLKYFVLGALSSGFMLFGISLIYGYSGSVMFDSVAMAVYAMLELDGVVNQGLLLGLVFLLAGLAFKISAVPFHMWTPDVYEGSPTTVTAFFSVVPKLAAFAILIQLLFGPFAALYSEWSQIVWFMAAASMVLAAFAALRQNNIKRLMAYSSISNVGFALIGVTAGWVGLEAVVTYLVIYMVGTLGLFAFILCLNKENQPVESISDLAGLSKTAPALSISAAVLLFSVSGIPPMAGFFAKLAIFLAAIQSGLIVLAVLGVLASVVSAFYYLRLIKVMFFDEGDVSIDSDYGLGKPVVLTMSVVFTLGYIFMPEPVSDIVRFAILPLL